MMALGPFVVRMEDKNVSREGASARQTRRSIEEVAAVVVGAAFHLHTDLGPGLFESVYETVLSKLLENQGLLVERQKPVAVSYAGIEFQEGFRLDVLVDKRLIIELKSVEAILPVHSKQLLTYLRLMDLPLGLVINFGAPVFRDSVKRVVNHHSDFAGSQLRVHSSESTQDKGLTRRRENSEPARTRKGFEDS